MAFSVPLRRAALLGALVLTAGCHDDDDDAIGPSRGELGFAVFEWGCTGFDELATTPCLDIEFPRDIVLGGSFSATFRLRSGLPSRIDARGLESGSPRFLQGDAGQFTAVRTGRVALLALGDDSVIDYTNLRIQEVGRVAVAAASNQPPCVSGDCPTAVYEGGAFVLYPGAQVRVEAIPFAGATRLWGRLDWSWVSTTPDLLSVTSEPGGNALLLPLSPGTATVEVTGGGITETIALVILDAPPPPPTPSDSGSGDGTATGETITEGTGGTITDGTDGTITDGTDGTGGTATGDTATGSGSDGSGSGDSSSTGGGS